MRALVFTAAGRVELRDEPDPVASDGQVLLRVRASGICGSELHGFRSTTFRKPPLIMGHEFAGTTPDGARVVVNPLLSCGACSSCAKQRPEVCRNRELLGVTRAGGFAEYVAVPESSVHVLPDDIGWAQAALIEPLANAVHAWSGIPDMPAEVAVIGAGPIGLVCALVAGGRGAAVTVHETSPSRRELAEKLGFHALPGLRDGAEFEVIVDAVGSVETRASSVTRCAPGGTAIWLGLADESAEFNGNATVRMEKRIAGSFAYRPADFAEAVALAASVDLSWATEVPLEDAAETFYALAEGRSSVVKAVVTPNGPGR